MKTIQIEQEFKIPKTDVVLEKGDTLRIRETYVKFDKEGLLDWVRARLAEGKKASWINWQSLPDGGFAGQMSPKSLKGFKTMVDHMDRIIVDNGNEQFLFALNYFDRFGVRLEAGTVQLANHAVLLSITFG